MKISIIIPIYNVAQYIERCIKSIMAQDYKGPLECILVDDCGPDNSTEIAQKLIVNYNGPIDFKIIWHEHNQGLSGARNTGTKASTGDYLYFLDSDDDIPFNAMTLLAAEVDRHPGVDIVMGKMATEDYYERYDIECFRGHQFVTDVDWLRYHVFLDGKQIPVNGCNKLVRKAFFIDNDLWFKPGIIHEDNHWMFRVLKYIKSFAFVFEPTYMRYWNEGSIMTGSNPEKEARNYQKIILDFSDKFYDPFVKLQICRYMNNYFSMKIYSYRYDGDYTLLFNVTKQCCKAGMYKEAFLLSTYTFLYKCHLNAVLNKVCSHHFRILFNDETARLAPKYPI